MRVVIAGGGTGGHLYPGIAVAREIIARVSHCKVTFVGTARGIEARVLPAEGFELDLIRSAGLKGMTLASIARGVMLLPLSAVDAWRVLSARRPSLVIGVGGYSSGPVLLLAVARGVPTMLLEQNARPGLTNRMLAPVVGAAAVTYPESLQFFRRNAFVAGNPVRPEFLRGGERVEAPPSRAGATRVLVTGGSQGAHAINLAMVDAAAQLAASQTVEMVHQTGARDLDMVREAYARAGLAATVEPYLFDMDRRMRHADLVVSRAGASTLAEIAAAGRPALLVPFPGATDDHQRSNAQALVRKGAALMVEQHELSGGRLAQEILALAGDAEKRRRLGEAARKSATPNAAKVIVDRALELATR